MTAMNFFLELLSSQSDYCYYQSLREEAAAAFQTEQDWQNLASLAKLPLTDSALRESLRLNPLAGRGNMRQVIHKDGLTLPGGHHLPPNAWIGASVIGIQRDDRYYTESDQFQPFRFVQSHTETSSDTNVASGTNTKQSRNTVYLATAEDKFMAWGYGRHSW